MGKPPLIVRPTKLTMALPEDVRARLDLELYSETESRVPHGAYQQFFLARLRDYFNSRPLDLAPFAGCEPGLFVVRAPKETIKILERTLKGEVPV